MNRRPYKRGNELLRVYGARLAAARRAAGLQQGQATARINELRALYWRRMDVPTPAPRMAVSSLSTYERGIAGMPVDLLWACAMAYAPTPEQAGPLFAALVAPEGTETEGDVGPPILAGRIATLSEADREAVVALVDRLAAH